MKIARVFPRKTKAMLESIRRFFTPIPTIRREPKSRVRSRARLLLAAGLTPERLIQASRFALLSEDHQTISDTSALVSAVLDVIHGPAPEVPLQIITQ
jgi:hypothetical protein